MTGLSLENILKVALTGGIGSGKSAAAHEFEKLGIPVIDSDAIAHQITAPNGLAMPAIIETFGAEYMNADGSLNRTKMRDLVFKDPESKRKLEAITHPLIRLAGKEAAQAAILRNPPYLIFMIPLLFESKSKEKTYEQIIVVDCPVETQIQRVIKRNGLERPEIERIINSQASRETRASGATYLINNSKDLQNLVQEVNKTHQNILKSISEKSH